MLLLLYDVLEYELPLADEESDFDLAEGADAFDVLDLLLITSFGPRLDNAEGIFFFVGSSASSEQSVGRDC